MYKEEWIFNKCHCYIKKQAPLRRKKERKKEKKKGPGPFFSE